MALSDQHGVIPGSYLSFYTQNFWVRSCTDWFFVPGDNNNLRFGVEEDFFGRIFSPDPRGSYLVDNISITPVLFSEDFESGSIGRFIGSP